jgi:hypothetical protein
MAICVWGSALLVNKKYIVKEVKFGNNYVQGHHTIAVNCNMYMYKYMYHTIKASQISHHQYITASLINKTHQIALITGG